MIPIRQITLILFLIIVLIIPAHAIGDEAVATTVISTFTSPGTLTVTSEPPGSSVFIDGISKGSTPITLYSLQAGTHTLQIDHAGYYEWRSPVTVPSGGKNVVSATLNPLPVSNTGGLSVSSTPGGAAVTIDGTLAGTTPDKGSLQLNFIPAGDHTINLTLGGYSPYTTISTVRVQSVTGISVILERSGTGAEKGALDIRSSPASADVFIDGTYMGVTPVVIPDVSDGTHSITIRLSGYSDYNTQVIVTTDITSVISAPLLPPASAPATTSSGLSGDLLGILALAGSYVIVLMRQK